MFVKKLGGDLRGMREGFVYFIRGARSLSKTRDLLPILIVPVLVNALLLALFIWLAILGVRKFLIPVLPATWWAAILVFVIVVTVIIAIVFIGAVMFVFIGAIVNSPFYDAIAEKTARSIGVSFPKVPWWKEIIPGARNATKKLWWYGVVQGGLVVLYVIPGLGMIAYTFLGFLATCFFLALEYLDFSPEFRKLSFTKRKEWCLERKGIILGFGAAIFVFLVIPVVNFFVPAAATAGAILLYHDYAKSNLPRQS